MSIKDRRIQIGGALLLIAMITVIVLTSTSGDGGGGGAGGSDDESACVDLWNQSDNVENQAQVAFLVLNAAAGGVPGSSDRALVLPYDGPPYESTFGSAIDDENVATIQSGDCIVALGGDTPQMYAHAEGRWIFVVPRDEISHYAPDSPSDTNADVVTSGSLQAGPGEYKAELKLDGE